MTEKELRDRCGLKDGELINTDLGLMDILSVKEDKVSLGLLASGRVIVETADSVIKKLAR